MSRSLCGWVSLPGCSQNLPWIVQAGMRRYVADKLALYQNAELR
jgi:hypothetical protein